VRRSRWIDTSESNGEDWFMRCLVFSLVALAAFGPTCVKATVTQTNGTDPRAVAIFAQPPEYPYLARSRRITGSGVVSMLVDSVTGKVTSCRMVVSTGSVILDGACLDAFRQWRFKPGMMKEVRVPITFTTGGRVSVEYRVKEKSMDDALAAFLGKGTVTKGPIPAYPRSVPWTNKEGRGVYELHVRKDGTVSEVKVLKRSGDETFDRTAVDTLRQWRLHRGPLVLELPLAFKLTATHYSVDIPKDR
jgi:TonB family protein